MNNLTEVGLVKPDMIHIEFNTRSWMTSITASPHRCSKKQTNFAVPSLASTRFTKGFTEKSWQPSADRQKAATPFDVGCLNAEITSYLRWCEGIGGCNTVSS